MDAILPGLRPTLRIEIGDVTQVAAARRSAVELARDIGFDEEDAGRAALVTTEAATNILKHAEHGEVLVSLRGTTVPGVEIIAIDKGPGFDPAKARADGFSTAGTLGQGLGAMQRIASEFDVYSVAGRGTALRAYVCQNHVQPSRGFDYGAIALPYPGESICGDGWLCLPLEDRVLVSVIDGLGAERFLERAHAAMRSTRGAAMAAALVDLSPGGGVRFAGVGNIGALVVGPSGNKHLVSMAGIMGHNVRKLREFEQAWEDGALLVMHSDGLGTRWDLAAEPGLVHQHPSIVAAVLYRDHCRGRDDATVFVLRKQAA